MSTELTNDPFILVELTDKAVAITLAPSFTFILISVPLATASKVLTACDSITLSEPRDKSLRSIVEPVESSPKSIAILLKLGEINAKSLSSNNLLCTVDWYLTKPEVGSTVSPFLTWNTPKSTSSDFLTLRISANIVVPALTSTGWSKNHSIVSPADIVFAALTAFSGNVCL